MKKNNIYLILFALLFNASLNSQPYYYTAKYELVDSVFRNFTTDIYRINMGNPAFVETLMTDITYRASIESDEYGNWLAYTEPYYLLSIMNLNNPAQKNVVSEYSEGVIKLSYASAVNKLVVLYLGNYPEPYKLILVDPSTLTITDSIPYSIRWECSTNEDIIFSKTGDVMYLMKTDTVLQKGYIAAYSLLSNQIINTKYLSDIYYPGKDDFFFNFRRNGLSVMESLFLLPTPTSYYQIYFLEKDSLSIPIIRDNDESWADGYVASEGNYLLLFNNLLNPDSLGFAYTGKIEIYDMTIGELKKTIQLPSGGKVMCFENYPDNVYYSIDIEEPTRQIYTFKMDSIFNVIDLTSLNPSSVIVNSSSFTLSVNGSGFDTLSTVYFNDTAKTTTFISDSVLTAEISSLDISVIGNYPVWVTDEWGTSDTLSFSVLPHPPVLTSISPSLALPVTYYSNNTDFTVTATGTNFTDSSVIYFDGSLKTTTYISDSVLTFQLNNYNDISSSNDYPVWVINYGSNSDTLYFSVVESLTQSLVAVVNCVRNNGDHTYTAFFGYNNSNNESVFISIGADNFFNPIQLFSDRGQPNIFLPGVHSSVFSVVFDGNDLPWYLNGTNATANRRSTPCP
jgi:hypothetical protein